MHVFSRYFGQGSPRADALDTSDLTIDEDVDLEAVVRGNYLKPKKGGNIVASATKNVNITPISAGVAMSEQSRLVDNTRKELFDTSNNSNSNNNKVKMVSLNPFDAFDDEGVSSLNTIMNEFHGIMAEVKEGEQQQVLFNNAITPVKVSNTVYIRSPSPTSSRIEQLNEVDKKIDSVLDILPDFLGKSPSNFTDIERLKITNDSLKQALRDEKSARLTSEKKILVLQDELDEAKTQGELDKESYKLELIRLNSIIRNLTNNSSMQEVFACFEENINRLLNENSLLREQILEYEANQDRSDRDQVNISQDSIVSIDNYKKNLISRLKRVGIEKEELKMKYEDLKSRERQFHLAQCVVHDSSRRIKFFHHEINKLREELIHEKEGREASHQENGELKAALGKIQEENSFLSNENAKLAVEIINLKSKFKVIDTDYRKLARLNKFIEKHATSSASSSAFTSSSIGVKNKSLSFQDSPIQIILHNLEEKYLYCNTPTVVTQTDSTLTLLQNKLMTEQVSALPLIRRLLNDVDSEREHNRVEKNEIFDIFYKELFPHTSRKRTNTPVTTNKTPVKK